jgi:hypothetical protein
MCLFNLFEIFVFRLVKNETFDQSLVWPKVLLEYSDKWHNQIMSIEKLHNFVNYSSTVNLIMYPYREKACAYNLCKGIGNQKIVSSGEYLKKYTTNLAQNFTDDRVPRSGSSF